MSATHHTKESLAGFAAPHDQAIISETEYNMLRHGLIPSYARNWIVREFGGVPSRVRRQLIEVAKEEEYDPATAIAVVFGVISSHKSLEKWKAANLRRSYQSINPSRKVNGKWVDMETTLWPPYERPLTRSGLVNNTVYHRPARYVFKHGNIRVDLGAQDGKFSPIPHNNPNSAMQSIATRLGRRLSGDYNKVAQQIVGDDNLIATSTAMRIGNQWVVLITMMRDPKVTPSSYHVTMEGNVVSNDPHHPSNSVSEVEYALIKGIIEEESEHSLEYCYEFDEDMQAQMLIEAMSDRLDAETMTPTELIMMELAAENGELIDFMSGSPTYMNDEYVSIIQQRIEETAKELAIKMRYQCKGLVPESEIQYAAMNKARYMHMETLQALEDCQRFVYGVKKDKSFFTMKGSSVARKRFFGVPSAYPHEYPAVRNPFSQTKMLDSGTYIPQVQRIVEPTGTPNPMSNKYAHFRGRPSSVCINADGKRAIAPAPKPKHITSNDNPRLAKVLAGLSLTGSLAKAIKLSKRK